MTPLRSHVNIVEKNICQGTFSRIDYDNVPRHAFDMNRRTFLNKDYWRFHDYLSTGKRDTEDYYTSPIQNYFVTNTIFDQSELWFDEFLENGKRNNVVFVVCDPNAKSIEIAIKGSCQNKGLFRNRVIAFKDGNPVFVNLDGTLRKRVDKLKHVDAVRNCVANEICDLVDSYVEQVGGDYPSNVVILTENFVDVGMEQDIVVWNVRGEKFSTQLSDGNVYIEGCNQLAIDMFLDKGCLTPETMMNSFIDSERYDDITL